MAQSPLSPNRIQQLVQQAKSMSYEELTVLVTAFSLECAQDMAQFMYEEEPEQLNGATRVSGMEFIDAAINHAECMFSEGEMVEVNNKYRLGEFFDLTVETEEVIIRQVKTIVRPVA